MKILSVLSCWYSNRWTQYTLLANLSISSASFAIISTVSSPFAFTSSFICSHRILSHLTHGTYPHSLHLQALWYFQNVPTPHCKTCLYPAQFLTSKKEDLCVFARWSSTRRKQPLDLLRICLNTPTVHFYWRRRSFAVTGSLVFHYSQETGHWEIFRIDRSDIGRIQLDFCCLSHSSLDYRPIKIVSPYQTRFGPEFLPRYSLQDREVSIYLGSWNRVFLLVVLGQIFA